MSLKLHEAVRGPARRILARAREKLPPDGPPASGDQPAATLAACGPNSKLQSAFACVEDGSSAPSMQL